MQYENIQERSLINKSEFHIELFQIEIRFAFLYESTKVKSKGILEFIGAFGAISIDAWNVLYKIS